MNEKIIEVCRLNKSFYLDEGFFKRKNKEVLALDNISMCLYKGETYGLVGESGSGKTTLSRLLISMYPPLPSTVFFYDENGCKKDVASLNTKELKEYRQKVKYIFQDPTKSLNPRLTVFDILTDSLRYSSVHYKKEELIQKSIDVLERVELSKDDLYKKSTSFSGGQKQRISLARALIMQPSVLICDEITSSLDTITQKEVLTLLKKLQKENGLTIFFITHNLDVALSISDRIGVMKKGKLIEEGLKDDILENPKCEYTKMLFTGY